MTVKLISLCIYLIFTREYSFYMKYIKIQLLFSGPYPTGAIEDRNFEVGFNGEFITNMLAPRIQEDSDQWRRGGNMIYCWYVSLPVYFRLIFSQGHLLNPNQRK